MAMGSGGQLPDFSDTFLPRSTEVSQFVMRQLPKLTPIQTKTSTIRTEHTILPSRSLCRKKHSTLFTIVAERRL